MRTCLHRIQEALTTCLPEIDFYTPLVYVDDLALHGMMEAEQVESVLTKAISIIYDTALQHGMRPNLSSGKTEAMIAYHGPDAANHRRRREKAEVSTITFPTTHAGHQQLRLVRSYKYLGSWIEDNSNLTPEIRVRTTQACAQMRPMQKRLIANPELDIQPRRQVVQTRGLSRAIFACGTWPTLNKTQMTMWQNGIMRVYRTLLPPTKTRPTTVQTLKTAELPTPTVLLRQGRHGVLMQLGKCGFTAYRDLVLQEDQICKDSFLGMIREDWHWINGFVANPHHDKLPVHFDAVDLVEYVATYQGRRHVTSLLHQAVRLHHCQLKLYDAAKHLYSDLAASLDPGAKVPQEVQQFPCPSCKKTFSTITGLSVHQRHKHKAVAQARYFAKGSQCEACMKEFHTRPRLIVHLQYSGTSCLRELAAQGQPMTEEARIQMDEADRTVCQQVRKTGRPTEAMRKLYLPPPALDEDDDDREGDKPDSSEGAQEHSELQNTGTSSPAKQLVTDPLVEAFVFGLLEFALEDLLEDVPQGFDRMTEYFSCFDLQKLTDAQYENLETEIHTEMERLSLHLDEIDVLLKWETFSSTWFPARPRKKRSPPVSTTQVVHPSRFAPHERFKLPPEVHDRDDWIQQAADLEASTLSTIWAQIEVPRLRLQNEVYLLLPFGGTRRTGDIPMWISWLGGNSTRTVIPVILDLGIHAYGDMLDSPRVKAWLDAANRGWVVAAHIAPPCETWSAARHLEPPEGAYKPRPLRSPECPWGLGSRDKKEMVQTECGTKLFAVGAYMTANLYRAGVPSSLEHPALWDGRSSIWRTGAIQWLLQQRHIEVFHFQQERFGQTAAKPTTFLLSNNQVLRRYLVQTIRNAGPRSHVHTLKGLDATTGEWATARTKAYPSQLCRCIAESALRHAEQAATAERSEKLDFRLAVEASFLCPDHDPYQEEAGHAPDFHQ